MNRTIALIDAALQYAALRYLAARGIVPVATKPHAVPLPGSWFCFDPTCADTTPHHAPGWCPECGETLRREQPIATVGMAVTAGEPEPVPCCYCGKPQTSTKHGCWNDDNSIYHPLCFGCWADDDTRGYKVIMAKLAADRAKAEAPAPLCGARDCRNPGCRPEVKP